MDVVILAKKFHTLEQKKTGKCDELESRLADVQKKE